MVDRRARALRVSRNRFIVDALRSVLQGSSTWSPGFIEALEDVDEETQAAVDEMERGIMEHRKSKTPVDFSAPAPKRKRRAGSR